MSTNMRRHQAQAERRRHSPPTEVRKVMSTIRIALLAVGLVAATATLQAQTSPPSGASPSTRSAADGKAGGPSGPATQGVEGSTGTQGGPDPAGGKNAKSATDPATGHDVDKSNATQGVSAKGGAQAGPQPNKAEEATGTSKAKAQGQ
jgi:hypothetical protein